MSRMKRSYSDLEQQQDDQPYVPYQQQPRGRQGQRYAAGDLTPPTAVAAAAVVAAAAANQNKIKMCMQCGTTRTPQWREGPLGPKTLCNACGVKRVRALKAMQQGRGGHASHGKKGSAAQRQAAAARAAQVQQQESFELAATLQLLAGNLDPMTAQPPAKKQARSAHSTGGRSKRASSYTAANGAAAAAGMDHETTAGATAPPGLVGSLQKALAAMAAKASIGCESNPTDSGEEISWSPNDTADGADNHGVQPLGGAASAVARKQQRQQLQLQRALLAAQANGQLAVLGEQVPEEHRQRGIYTAEPCEADEADAAANLLSISGADGPAGVDGPAGAAGAAPVLVSKSGSASKAAVRELVAALSGGGAGAGTGRGAPVGGRQLTPPGSRHGLMTKPRAAAVLKEEDLLYLMGPGMPVLARHVAPDQMLEVMRLNEMLAEAQRNAAAANAAVAAVDKILQEKRAVAEMAATSAFTAARQLHSYVNGLNSQHSLMQQAAQAAVQAQHEAAAAHIPDWPAGHDHDLHYVMPPAAPATAHTCALASSTLGCGAGAGGAGGGIGRRSRVGSITQLDVLAAMHQQQQRQAAIAAPPGALLKSEPTYVTQMVGAGAAAMGGGHHQQQTADSGIPSDSPTPAYSPGVSPLLTALERTPRMSAKVAGWRGGSSMVEPLDLNDCAAEPMERAAVAAAELPADEEELEAAALLGSLHDLAALPFRGGLDPAGGRLSAGQQGMTAVAQGPTAALV